MCGDFQSSTHRSLRVNGGKMQNRAHTEMLINPRVHGSAPLNVRHNHYIFTSRRARASRACVFSPKAHIHLANIIWAVWLLECQFKNSHYSYTAFAGAVAVAVGGCEIPLRSAAMWHDDFQICHLIPISASIYSISTCAGAVHNARTFALDSPREGTRGKSDHDPRARAPAS